MVLDSLILPSWHLVDRHDWQRTRLVHEPLAALELQPPGFIPTAEIGPRAALECDFSGPVHLACIHPACHSYTPLGIHCPPPTFELDPATNPYKPRHFCRNPQQNNNPAIFSYRARPVFELLLCIHFFVAMATVMASMNVTGVQSLNGVATVNVQHLGSSSARLGGLRLNVSGLTLRSEGRRSVVVRAEEGITDKAQNAVGGAANKVKDTAGAVKGKVEDVAGAAKGKLEQAGDYIAGSADEAKDKAKDAGGKVQNEAEKLGDKAADTGRDLEGKAKDASKDARNNTESLTVSALTRRYSAALALPSH